MLGIAAQNGQSDHGGYHFLEHSMIHPSCHRWRQFCTVYFRWQRGEFIIGNVLVVRSDDVEDFYDFSRRCTAGNHQNNVATDKYGGFNAKAARRQVSQLTETKKY